MYFLNDKHQKYEYCVYKRVGNALPYISELKYITDIGGIYRYIKEIENKHNHYRQFFYIDNDFYKNKFSIETGGTYYKFLRRPVADWEEFYTENNSYNNIYYLYR